MDATIGEIRLFAGDYAPEGWLFCNGQVLEIGMYYALYGIIGANYGGDDENTFALPSMTPLKEADGGATPIQYIIATQGYYPSRPD